MSISPERTYTETIRFRAYTGNSLRQNLAAFSRSVQFSNPSCFHCDIRCWKFACSLNTYFVILLSNDEGNRNQRSSGTTAGGGRFRLEKMITSFVSLVSGCAVVVVWLLFSLLLWSQWGFWAHYMSVNCHQCLTTVMTTTDGIRNLVVWKWCIGRGVKICPNFLAWLLQHRKLITVVSIH